MLYIALVINETLVPVLQVAPLFMLYSVFVTPQRSSVAVELTVVGPVYHPFKPNGPALAVIMGGVVSSS